MNEWERKKEREVNKKLYNLATRVGFFTNLLWHGCKKKFRYTNLDEVGFFIF